MVQLRIWKRVDVRHFICSAQAIKGLFPETFAQICIEHKIRNSCKFVVWKDRKVFCANIKNIYAVTNTEFAENALEEMERNWGTKYKYAIQSW